MRRLAFAIVPAVAILAIVACAPTAEVVGDADLALGDAVSCLDSQDCAGHCEAMLDEAKLSVSPPTFESSRCELAAVVSDDAAQPVPAPSCLCMQGGSDPSALILSATGPDSCLLYGRDRNCLYEKASFPGCDPSEPQTSCEQVCDEVQRRLAVDALRRPSVHLRAATCANTGCHCVLRIDDSCFVDDWLDAYDCGQDDDAIVRAFESELRAQVR